MTDAQRRLTLSREQLRFIESLVSRNNEGTTSVDLEDRGGDAVLVRLFDKTGHEIGSQLVKSRGNELSY